MRQTLMINTILAPTDGSQHADKAVSFAGELARMYGAKITLLHCVADIIHAGIPKHLQGLADAGHDTIGDVLIAFGEEVLKNAEAQVRNQGLEDIETVIPSGHPVQAIVDFARARQVDLIVMGSRGLSDLEVPLLGSVSHKVNSLAPCSCVTVR